VVGYKMGEGITVDEDLLQSTSHLDSQTRSSTTATNRRRDFIMQRVLHQNLPFLTILFKLTTLNKIYLKI